MIEISEFNFHLPENVLPGQLICPECDFKQSDDKTIVYKFIEGPGTKILEYNIDGNSVKAITATLLGKVKIEEKKSETNDSSEGEEMEEDSKKSTKSDKETSRSTRTLLVSVVQKDSSTEINSSNNDFANNLPKEGDIILTRVTRISQQRANVEILAVENATVPVDSGIGSNGTGVIATQGGSGAATFSIAQASSDLGETFRGIIRSQDVRATERDSVKIIDCFKPGDIVRAQVLSLGDGTNYYLSTARNDLGVVFAKAANGAGGLMYALDWQTMCVPINGATEKRKCAKPF